ncbi:MAG: DNA repair protein RadC [Alphaproteobacteria bacterium]
MDAPVTPPAGGGEDAARPASSTAEAPAAKAKPHYHGHRDRLRERFLAAGVEGLQDYELLELILFRAMPRRDVKPLAKALLERFGGLAGVLAADIERLTEVSGIGQAVAIELKLVYGVSVKLLQEQVLDKPLLSSSSQLFDYLRARLSTEKIEQFRILFLDNKNRLIADEMQQQGTVNHTPVYTREVIRRALELHASAIILVHNHPSGDPSPSRDDVSMTMKIIEAGRTMNIRVHDHLIVGRSRVLSLRQEGYMGA